MVHCSAQKHPGALVQTYPTGRYPPRRRSSARSTLPGTYPPPPGPVHWDPSHSAGRSSMAAPSGRERRPPARPPVSAPAAGHRRRAPCPGQRRSPQKRRHRSAVRHKGPAGYRQWCIAQTFRRTGHSQLTAHAIHGPSAPGTPVLPSIAKPFLRVSLDGGIHLFCRGTAQE